ncbi:MAG TPA: hypothetical protein VM118_09400 [Acidobacteriota bacterium]|nr:hypothetical protein [Acidobacteriota bacterium]
MVRFLRFILRNLSLKIVALILALLLWFHVATNQEYDIELAYTFDYVNLSDSVLLTTRPPEAVGVRLQGSGKQLLRLWWSDRTWEIDLSGAGAGEMAIDLWADDVPRFGIEDIEVLGLTEPGRLNLRLDSLATKTVPVWTDEVFAVSSGYIGAGPLILTPDSVQVSGPRSRLVGINRLTLVPTGREEWNKSIDEETAVALPPAYNVTAAPDRVRVQRLIEPFVTHTYDSLPIAIVPSEPDEPCTVDPAWVSVEIGGPASQMAYLTGDSVKVVYAAARKDTSGARCALWVDVPAPFQVLKVRPDSITVHRDELSRTDSGT